MAKKHEVEVFMDADRKFYWSCASCQTAASKSVDSYEAAEEGADKHASGS